MYKFFLKRFFDFIFATIGFIFFLPIFIFIIFFVYLKLGSPIFYVQSRPGLDGKIFKLFKFRTMTNEVDENGKLLSDEYRLTAFGRFLRSSSIDELPSLLCVISGKMSLVGPRPLLIEYLPLYSKKQARRHDVRPGITGWAQINGRNTVSWNKKFEMDLWYVENYSFWLDIKILWFTLIKVFKQVDISHNDHVTMSKFKGK